MADRHGLTRRSVAPTLPTTVSPPFLSGHYYSAKRRLMRRTDTRKLVRPISPGLPKHYRREHNID